MHELGPGEVLDFQQGLARRGRALGIDVLQVAPDHQLDQIIHRHIGDLPGADVAPVFEHGDLIGQLKDFPQPVRNVDDADALRLE